MVIQQVMGLEPDRTLLVGCVRGLEDVGGGGWGCTANWVFVPALVVVAGRHDWRCSTSLEERLRFKTEENGSRSFLFLEFVLAWVAMPLVLLSIVDPVIVYHQCVKNHEILHFGILKRMARLGSKDAVNGRWRENAIVLTTFHSKTQTATVQLGIVLDIGPNGLKGTWFLLQWRCCIPIILEYGIVFLYLVHFRYC